MGAFFLRFVAILGIIFGVPETPQIGKIRVRLRKAPGRQFYTYFGVLLNVIWQDSCQQPSENNRNHVA